MPKLISTCGHRQRPARPSTANRMPAMAHSCRYSAGGEQAGITDRCAGLGRRWQSLPKVGTAYQMPPMRSSATSPPAGYTTNARGPGYAVHVQARVELAGLGALPAPPLYCAERPPVDRPDGAKSAVGMCGPRVTQGPLPVGHAPLRATTVPGVCGPRGPPMAHQKSDEWAIGKPRAPWLKWVSTRNVEKSAPKCKRA